MSRLEHVEERRDRRRVYAAERAARWLERLRDHPHPGLDLAAVDVVALTGHMTDLVEAILHGVAPTPSVQRCHDELGVDLTDPHVARWLSPHGVLDALD